MKDKDKDKDLYVLKLTIIYWDVFQFSKKIENMRFQKKNHCFLNFSFPKKKEVNAI